MELSKALTCLGELRNVLLSQLERESYPRLEKYIEAVEYAMDELLFTMDDGR